MSDYSAYPDIEVLTLRKKVKELEEKILAYEATLREHELSDKISTVSTEELICVREISKLDELSRKQGLMLEDTKIFDTLVKALHLIRSGKEVKEDKSKNKKNQEKIDVAKLLHIAGKSET